MFSLRVLSLFCNKCRKVLGRQSNTNKKGMDIENILGVSKIRVALIGWRAPACHEEQGSSMIQRG